MKIKATDKVNYPPRWKDYEANVPSGFPYMGFGKDTTVGDVNRFGARYRAAKSFKHADFAVLSDSTAHGYTALIKLLLCYSAFEHLLGCLGWRQKDSEGAIPAGEQDRVMEKLRGIEGHEKFFGAAADHLGGDKGFVEDYLAGKSVNPAALAGAIRHAFAHGKLTPGSGGNDGACPGCCFVLVKFLGVFMDREFVARVSKLDNPYSPE